MTNKLRLCLTLLILITTSALASPTGRLRGRLLGADGAPLAGAAVRLTGPALQLDRVVETDARGEYVFQLLPAGVNYTLTASHPAHPPLVRRGIQIPLGAEVSVDAAAPAAVMSETVVVTAPAPLLEVTSAAVTTNVRSEEFEKLPSRRDFQQLTVLEPLAVFDRDALNPAIGGATHLENDYLIEGLSTRSVMSGRSASKLTISFVEEVQVLTSGAGAEHGRFLGGLISVITKSGGNQWAGDIATYYDNDAWRSGNVLTAYRGAFTYDLGNDRRDVAASLGGPLVRDHLWLFAAANPRQDVRPVHLVDAEMGIDIRDEANEKQTVYAAKLTGAAGSQLLSLSAFGHPTKQSGWLNGARNERTVALMNEYYGSENLAARYQLLGTRRSAIEINAGQHGSKYRWEGATELGRTVPFQEDMETGFGRGGLLHEGFEKSSRRSVAARHTLLWRQHELRYGADLERNRFDSSYVEPGYFYFGKVSISEEIGVKDSLTEQLLDNKGYGTNAGRAAFVQDRWSVTDRFVVTAGMRWEEQELGSGLGVKIATGRRADGKLDVHAADTYTFANNWAPRVGVAWDLNGRGTGKLYASFGRYFEAIPVAINVNALNGFSVHFREFYSPTSLDATNWFNPVGSPLSNNQWIQYAAESTHYNGLFANSGPVPIEDGAKLQSQGEVAVGVEYQVGAAWTAGARIVQRELHDIVDDHAVYAPGKPFQQIGYVIGNVGQGEFGSEFDEPTRRYSALAVTLQRRLSNRWQALASFVTSRERGDYDGAYNYANSGDALNQSPQIETPARQRKSYGRMRGDVPYSFKLHSSVDLPYGITIGEGFSYSAGVPISAFAARRLLGGLRAFHLVPRGSMGRTPDHWSLDTHIAWRVPVRSLAVTVVADVFNVTDQHAVLDVDEEYFRLGQPDYQKWIAPDNRDEWGNPKFNPNLSASQFYKTATRYQEPRNVQLGVRLSF